MPRLLRLSVVAALASLALLVTGCQSDHEHSGQLPDRLRFDAGTIDDGTGPGRSTGLFVPGDSSGGGRPRPGQPPIQLPIRVATVSGEQIGSFPTATAPEPDQWFSNPTQFGGQRVFRVVDDTSHPDLVQVSLPSMPNGQVGWLRRDDIDILSIEHQAVVDLAQRSVIVWRDDEIVAETDVVIGTPWTPTPTGVFYVRDLIEQPGPNGDYGSYILALSGFSEVLESFAGGLPAIAIHGTNKPETMGQERSNGCVRVPNKVVELLAKELPLGTPVTIIAGVDHGQRPVSVIDGVW